jgi:hypothetical protein
MWKEVKTMKNFHNVRNTQKALLHGASNGMGPFSGGRANLHKMPKKQPKLQKEQPQEEASKEDK